MMMLRSVNMMALVLCFLGIGCASEPAPEEEKGSSESHIRLSPQPPPWSVDDGELQPSLPPDDALQPTDSKDQLPPPEPDPVFNSEKDAPPSDPEPQVICDDAGNCWI